MSLKKILVVSICFESFIKVEKLGFHKRHNRWFKEYKVPDKIP